jgi:hypothetical protein
VVLGRQSGFLSATTMPPPHLPAELLDHTVDHLHDARIALKSCCLVSKSWVPRTRKHLFAEVEFNSQNLQSWKTTFPDPFISPACYTKDLVVRCPGMISTTDAEERGWFRAFSHVVHLELSLHLPIISLLPFHGFSLSLKSLHVEFRCLLLPRVLNLVHSSSLLEDLSLIVWGDDPIEDFVGQLTVVQPPLVRSLTLDVKEGINHVVSHLFPPHNSLNFRQLNLWLAREEDIFEISALVERCRSTLESLEVGTGKCCGMSV